MIPEFQRILTKASLCITFGMLPRRGKKEELSIKVEIKLQSITNNNLLLLNVSQQRRGGKNKRPAERKEI